MYMYRTSTSQELSDYENIVIFYSSAHGKKISGNYERFLDRNEAVLRDASYVIGIPYGADISETAFEYYSEILSKEIRFHKDIRNVSNELRFIFDTNEGKEFSGYMAEKHNGTVDEIKGMKIGEGTLYVYPFRSGWEEGGSMDPNLGRVVAVIPLVPATALTYFLGGSAFLLLFSYFMWLAVSILLLLLSDLMRPAKAKFLYKHLRNRNGTVRDVPKIGMYRSICVATISIIIVSDIVCHLLL